jgi:uncharacterized protein YecT (DUF1311 family)
MSSLRNIYVALRAILFSLIPVYSHGDNLPNNLVGRWQVQEVHINTASGRLTKFSWGDPRLKWRIFDFSDAKIESDAYDFDDKCVEPSAKYVSATANDLFFRSIGGYDYPPMLGINPVMDYRININAEKNLRAIILSCADGIWQGDLGVSDPKLGDLAVRGAWIILQDDHSMYLRWRDESVLRLEKIWDRSPIIASFDCAKAGTKTERAICASYRLSAFDRSVADAFERYTSQASGPDLENSMKGQRIWLRQRDACGFSEKCILEQMRFRLNDLFSH